MEPSQVNQGNRAIAAGTIISKNYLPFARVLATSLKEHNPDIPLFVLLMDEVDGYFDPAAEPFKMIGLREISPGGALPFGPDYDQVQLLTAAKPFLLGHLLDAGYGMAMFLDADILVLSDLKTPLMEMPPGVTLTPHLLAPLDSHDRACRELNILQSGCFNAGFLAVSNTHAAREFLTWWQGRVKEHCRPAVAEGIHFDQRWLDLAPVFFQDVQVMRHPGFNVGHWNLPERELREADGRLTVAGKPCYFFHFSGFDLNRPAIVTRYNERLTMDDIGPAAANLFKRYAGLVMAAGYKEAATWPFRNPVRK